MQNPIIHLNRFHIFINNIKYNEYEDEEILQMIFTEIHDIFSESIEFHPSVYSYLAEFTLQNLQMPLEIKMCILEKLATLGILAPYRIYTTINVAFYYHDLRTIKRFMKTGVEIHEKSMLVLMQDYHLPFIKKIWTLIRPRINDDVRLYLYHIIKNHAWQILDFFCETPNMPIAYKYANQYNIPENRNVMFTLIEEDAIIFDKFYKKICTKFEIPTNEKVPEILYLCITKNYVQVFNKLFCENISHFPKHFEKMLEVICHNKRATLLNGFPLNSDLLIAGLLKCIKVKWFVGVESIGRKYVDLFKKFAYEKAIARCFEFAFTPQSSLKIYNYLQTIFSQECYDKWLVDLVALRKKRRNWSLGIPNESDENLQNNDSSSGESSDDD